MVGVLPGTCLGVCVLVADQSGGFWYYHHGGFQLTIVL